MLLLTSVWSNVCAGLQDKQPSVVIPPMDIPLCSPASEPTRDTICAGESYTWNGNTYSKPGSYTDTLTNIYGCDSIVTLHLEVLPDPPITFTVNGVSFKMMRVRAGTFIMGATPEQGADAQANEKPAHEVTLTRDYFVSETVLTQELWTAVMGTTIQEEEAKGTGEKNLGYGPNYPMYCLSHNDCLLFVEQLNQLTGLTFRMPTEAEWEYAARGGHLSRGYKYPGSNDPFEVAWSIENDPQKKLHPVKLLKPNELGLYDMAGNVWEYIYDFRRTYTAELQVNPMGNISGNQANVRGGSTAWNTGYNRVSCRHIPTGISKDEKSGRRAFRFVLDADRVIGEDNTTYQAYDTICAGESYTWNGNTYTKPGSYTDTLSNIHGCDSIVTLHLEVNPTYEIHDTIVACDSYTFNPFNLGGGITICKSGTYKDTTTSISGCDSVFVLHLTINYRDTAFFTETAYDSYTWHDQVYNTSGTYYYTTQTALGCDSVEILYLTMLPPTEYFVTDTLLCHGVTCEWRNMLLTTAGTYNDTVKNQLDCDSIIYMLNLEYLPDVQHFATDTALCYGEVCDWRGAIYQESGIYHDTIRNILSCDSLIYTLNLVIYPEIPITHVTDTMAGAEYHWNDQIYTHGGDYTMTLPAITGCDSVVILHLMDNYAAIDTVIVYEQCAGSGEQEVEILTQGYIEQIVLNYSPQAQAAGLRDTVMMLSSTDDIYTIYYDLVRAGVHEVTAIGLFHGVEVASYPFTLTYLYPNTIFEQLNNDLIAILTAPYNGGYDFIAFQWYKNGAPILGETHSYLNQSLSLGAEYSALLTTADGVQLMSCPIIAEDKAELSVYPTILKHGEMVKCHMTDEYMLFIHNSTGKIIQEQPLKAGTTAITLPAISGVYLLRFISNDHIERTFKVIVV